MPKIISQLVSFAVVFLAFGARGVMASVFEGAGEGNDAQTGVGYVEEALRGSGVTEEGSLSVLILKYVNFFLPYLALAAFVGYVYAGVLYVAAFGEEELISKSKKILIYSTMGLILVILSYVIVNLFTSDLVESIATQ